MDSAPPSPSISRTRGMLVTGLTAWAAVLLAGLAGIPYTVGPLSSPVAVAWLVVLAIFGVELVLNCLPRRRPANRTLEAARVLLLSVLALAANWLVPLAMPGVAIGGVLLVVVAARAALSPISEWTWRLIVVQTVALGMIYVGASHWPAAVAWVAALAFGAFQVLAMVLGTLAESERRARAELALSLGTLQSTQALLADAAAQAERHRIDRELHDVLGHHLTVLSLQLQRAGALSTGEPAQLIAQAHALTRLVLADVRSVVAEPSPAVDLAGAVRSMGSTLPGVTVTLEGAEALSELPSAVAHALLRCVQEGVTNAVRHGGAQSITVRAARTPGSIVLLVLDDGRGPGTGARQGGGIQGLQDRLGLLGGSATLTARPTGGTELRVKVLLPIGGTTL